MELGQTQEEGYRLPFTDCAVFSKPCVWTRRGQGLLLWKDTWAESCSALQRYQSSLPAVEAAPSLWEGTAPSCQIFARSEAAAEPNCNEYSRGCLVLSINPWEVPSFLTGQLGSSGFRSLEHMKHFPRGILIGSTQEIHFCFCEISQ